MAGKTKSVYVCSQCGCVVPKWCGQCPDCGEWNTLTEEIRTPTDQKKTAAVHTGTSPVLFLNEIQGEEEMRYNTGIGELNRVLGGGLVKGSLVLLSGDPGIGKSTILLQACSPLGKYGNVLYVSGEESKHQLKLRAERLGVKSENLLVMCETDAQYICEYITSEKPVAVIIDSIQTMMISDISSLAGSITQVRECASLFMRTAKALGIPFVIVGHVNKDGNIAGPKVLEHIVDCVLYFEGDKNLSCRILRAVKNRFGSTNEMGVFEMSGKGLEEVPNPSQMLISGRPVNVPGSCVTCIMEGSRPILAEIQGLVCPSNFGNPRRMSNGFDYNRMSMIIAVLEKRAGFFLGNADCYLNVAAGLRVDEPSTDLAAAMALVSSLKDVPVRDDVIVIGEIGLAGEIRSVNVCEQRVREAKRLGFRRCVIPETNYRKLNSDIKNEIELIGVKNIREAFDSISC